MKTDLENIQRLYDRFKRPVPPGTEYQERLDLLNYICKEYELPIDLHARVKKTFGYGNKKEMTDITHFISQLPHKLKVECSLYIFENRYSKIKFFVNQSSSFIAWMCPMLKPH